MSDRIYQKNGLKAFESKTSKILTLAEANKKKLLLVPENGYDMFY